MKRALTRLATFAVALPLAVAGVAGTANAGEILFVPGCYGGGTNGTVICNISVSAGLPVGVYTYQGSVPICVGTCQYVPVTLVGVSEGGESPYVCVRYTTGVGTNVTRCVSDPSGNPTVQGLLERVGDIVCNAIYPYVECGE